MCVCSLSLECTRPYIIMFIPGGKYSFTEQNIMCRNCIPHPLLMSLLIHFWLAVKSHVTSYLVSDKLNLRQLKCEVFISYLIFAHIVQLGYNWIRIKNWNSIFDRIPVMVDKKQDWHFKIPIPVNKNHYSDLEIPLPVNNNWI